MESKLKGNFLKVVFVVIAFGIWAIVLQNAGIIPTKQNVYVKGGYVNADISGNVSVDNEIDVNISSVNGHSNAFYGPGESGTYDAIHVYTGQ